MKELNLLLTEGTEIVYTDPRKLDMFGIGVIQRLTTRKDLSVPMMVEIVFPDALTAQRQFLPVDVFMERIRKKEIELASEENADLYREQELLNRSLSEAVREASSFSIQELSNLIERLKKRVGGENRLKREEAVMLLGEASMLLNDADKIREVLNFLLEQTKVGIKKRRASPQSSYSLSLAGRLQREQLMVIAKCLEVSAEIALKKGDEEMSLLVKKAAHRLQAHSSKILKTAAATVLNALHIFNMEC